jgi:hypothetical protein
MAKQATPKPRLISTDLTRSAFLAALEGSIAEAAIGQDASDCLAITSDTLEAIGIHADLNDADWKTLQEAQRIVKAVLDGNMTHAGDDDEE